MVDAVHSISTQIHAATAGHKRIEMVLKRCEFIMLCCFVLVYIFVIVVLISHLIGLS